jgi:transposase
MEVFEPLKINDPMANKPIAMSKLRQVVKLHCQGCSKLHISSVTGLSRNTIRKYLHILVGLKTTWEEVSKLPDKELDELFCKEPEPIRDDRIEVIHDFFKKSDNRLKQRGVNLLHLWKDYHGLHPEGFQMTAFYRHYGLWKRRVYPSMHMTHKVGDKMFIDFTGEKRPYVDVESGEIRQAEVFVSILGASQLIYVEATVSQSNEDLIACTENSVHYFGGAPHAVVPDNLKAAVTKSHRYEPKLNENFEAFADHYGMAVIPARVYKPKDKALVEGAVKIVYSRIFSALPEVCLSLQDMNDRILELLESLNKGPFNSRSYSRFQQFVDIEKGALQPLPEKRFELRDSRVATVMKNGHVCLAPDKHYYSVPYEYISKKVRLLFSKSKVEIFYKYECIAAHDRVRHAHNYTTDPAHLASQHRAMAQWNPEHFLEQARGIGKEVELYIAQVLQRKPHPEQAYKSCQGILSFAKRIGHRRLIKACQRAHGYGLYHFRAIEDILRRGLDIYDLDQEGELPMPTHPNIRGKDYYQ